MLLSYVKSMLPSDCASTMNHPHAFGPSGLSGVNFCSEIVSSRIIYFFVHEVFKFFFLILIVLMA